METLKMRTVVINLVVLVVLNKCSALPLDQVATECDQTTTHNNLTTPSILFTTEQQTEGSVREKSSRRNVQTFKEEAEVTFSRSSNEKDTGSRAQVPMFQHDSEETSSRQTDDPTPSTSEPCEANTFTKLTALRGNITWTGTKCDNQKIYWQIDVNSSYGLVLQFYDNSFLHQSSEMKGENSHQISLTVFNGSCADPRTKLRSANGSAPLPVLVWPGNELCVKMFRYTEKGSNSSFPSISYAAYPQATLPVSNNDSEYHCADPYVVPEELKCDMVKHCDNGKDEENCAYHKDGCGGEHWVPFKDVCFKLLRPNPTYPANHFLAKKWCAPVESYSVTTYVAQLVKPENIVFVGKLAALSGLSEVIVGLQKASTTIPQISQFFRFMWQWSESKSLAIGLPVPLGDDPLRGCAVLVTTPSIRFRPVACVEDYFSGFVCMKDNPQWKMVHHTFHDQTLPTVTRAITQFDTKRCPDGSFVHPFHYCRSDDPEDHSWSRDNLPLFQCSNGVQIHYSLLCDGKFDCGDADHSDEQCQNAVGSAEFSPAMNYTLLRCKWSVQLIRQNAQCNGVTDCFDQSDEKYCSACAHTSSSVMCGNHGCVPASYRKKLKLCHRLHNMYSFSPENYVQGEYSVVEPKPMLLKLDGFGLASVQKIEFGDSCPETHYQCPNGDCIPTYLLGMRRHSCPNDAEFFWKGETCEGHYQCYNYDICLHPDFLCDGVYHCPLKDDELHCDLNCPANCTCEGYALTCSQSFYPYYFPFVRYLDMSGNKDSVQSIFLRMINIRLKLLSFLNFSSCGLDLGFELKLNQLRVLDLSFNNFRNLSLISFTLPLLTHLNLSGNPLLHVIDHSFSHFLAKSEMLSLTHMSLARTGVTYLEENSLQNMTDLEFLEIHGNDIKDYHHLALAGLDNLRVLRTDDFKLCCYHAAVVDTDESLQCVAPVDELSSCSRIIRYLPFRVFLWLVAATAILGNASTLIYRLCISNDKTTCPSHRILVANLCVSDLLMGLYILIIGGADSALSGQYLWKEAQWKSSALCKTAGFLALLSGEVSSLIICFITLDRLLLLRFPFRRNLHLQQRGATIGCSVLWFVGATLASVPLLPGFQHWQFYGQTGICLPLPITRRKFPGQPYAFSIFIVFNFVLFFFIGVGQLLIYQSIRHTPFANRSERRQQDMAVARRLFLVVFTDFCCWFPVGLMGILASVQGTPIPDDVNVFVAIFVLPINSAINPFLYTLNVVLEKWRKREDRKRVQYTIDTLHTDAVAWRPDRLRNFLHGFVATGLVKKEWLQNWACEMNN